jgi:hypothetical protein
MKTKILYRLAFAAIIVGSLLPACKKSSTTADNGSSSVDLQVQADDQTRISNESDAVEDDANVAMGAEASVSGASAQLTGYGQGRSIEGVQGVNSPGVCDAAITVDSIDNPRTITLTYNGGTGCNATRTRTGVVVISIPAGTRWRDTGAVITVKFVNLKITSLIDNKSITINGTHTYTNVSGGSLVDLYTGKRASIIHTITSSNMSISFDNNTQRVWSVARQRTFTYPNQNVTITTTGMHAVDTLTGISEWGTNRFGNAFTTSIAPNNPIVIQSACGWRVTSGQVKTVGPLVTTTAVFGLDSMGNPVQSCPVGNFYLKLTWQGPSQSYSAILPY